MINVSDMCFGLIQPAINFYIQFGKQQRYQSYYQGQGYEQGADIENFFHSQKSAYREGVQMPTKKFYFLSNVGKVGGQQIQYKILKFCNYFTSFCHFCVHVSKRVIFKVIKRPFKKLIRLIIQNKFRSCSSQNSYLTYIYEISSV